MSSTQEVGEIFGAGSGPAHAMLRSPTVIIASIGLWGMNVYFFRIFGIDYNKVLHHDLVKMEAEEESDNLQKHRRIKSRNSNNNNTNNSNNNNNGVTRKDSENDIAAANDAIRIESKSSHNKNSSTNNNISSNNSISSLIDDEEIAIMDISTSNNILQQHNDELSSTLFDDEISSGQLICLSITLLIMLHTTYAIWIDFLGGGSIGAIFAFYGAITIAIAVPLQSNRWLRHVTMVVLHRAYELINPRCHCCKPNKVDNDGNIKPPRPIPFIDVFFADAMCSLSKVFFDWGMLLHMMSYYPNPVPKSAWNIIIPSCFASIPFFIRARQCIVMWNVTSIKNDPTRYQHLWNALKYSTSIFPLILSAYQKTVLKERSNDLEFYLIILLIINAGYALWWDIVMDWGMMKNPSKAATVICNPVSNNTSTSYSMSLSSRDIMHGTTPVRTSSGPVNPANFSCWYALLRSRLRFGVAMSVLILITDVILRFSWTLRFYHKLFPSGDSFVLCTQFLEVLRRALWNLLRVEWENLKQSGQHHFSAQPIPRSPIVQLTSLNLSNEETAYLVQRGNNTIGKLAHDKKAKA